jgi:uridine kinase
MPYEVPIYRARLFDQFAEWTRRYQDNPLREDAYTRAARVYKVLSQVDPVTDESAVPGDSVLREFIGGSIYKY